MTFAVAQRVADAVLYEGYMLYPYRASALKNQVRWQFGVVMPHNCSEHDSLEPWTMQTECVVEPGETPTLDLRIRFLQVQARRIEEAVDAEQGIFRPVEKLTVDGQQYVTWDEGIVHEEDFSAINVRELLVSERVLGFVIPGGHAYERLRDKTTAIKGRVVRERWPLIGVVRLTAEPLDKVLKVRVRVENLSEGQVNGATGRSSRIRHAFVATHTLLAVHDGAFVSLVDPPAWAQQAVASCTNLSTWPALIGQPERRDVLLSSPIILPDYPQIAPESSGDAFDATEIDELLTLRTMTLTDEEKGEARCTDVRAAALLDRIEAMPPELLDRLHGAVRYLRGAPEPKHSTTEPLPWWDPEVDAAVSPDTDCLQIGGVFVSKGSRVRLCPGSRRGDAQDMFLTGRTAIVSGVFHDVDGKSYLAVTLVDDPAADIHQWHGRYLYFAPDEVEPLEDHHAKGTTTTNEHERAEGE